MDDSYRKMMRDWLGIDEVEARIQEHEVTGNHGGGGEPGPGPVPGEGERIIPMYDPGECQVFIKDFDATETESIKTVGGYCRGETVHVWLHASNLKGNSGPVYIIPNPVQQLIAFGGLRNEVKGVVRIWNDKDGTDNYRGDAEWYKMPDGRYALRFRFVDVFPHASGDGKLHTMKVQPNYPFNFQYGVNLFAEITLI